MLTTTLAFANALAAGAGQPIWLVEFLGVNEAFLSDRITLSGAWLAGQGPVAGSGVLAGATRTTYQYLLAEGGRGLGALRSEIDPLSEAVRIAGTTITLNNQGGYSDRLYTTGPLSHCVVRVALGFPGLQYGDFLPLFRGVIDRYQVTWSEVSIEILDDTFRQHRDLSTRLGQEYFLNTPRANRGRAIPIIIGRATDVEAIQVTGNASGTLGIAIGTTESSIYLREFDAPFPAAGTIDLGSESGVTYTLRARKTIAGITYLELRGLTRSSPASQAAGVAVTLTSGSAQYLVSYEVGEITAVRIDDVIQSGGYTAVTNGVGAEPDKRVSYVTFNSAPGSGARVTVDADGLNVSRQEIANGNFELGILAPWVQGTGATATVGTGNTQEGAYKLSLTGAQDTFKDAYVDIHTTVGRFYTLEFYYRDQVDGSNVLTNGSFESGLTGWTSHQLGDLQSYAAPVTGLVHDGSQSIEMGNNQPSARSEYMHEVYQDVTTAIGSEYSLVFVARCQTIVGLGGGGAWSYMQTRAGYALGTPTNAVQYGVELFPAPANLTAPQFRAFGPLPFTALTTTSRVSLRGYGFSDSNGFAYPMHVDGAVLVQTTNLPTSTSGYKLGSSSDDDLYASETLTQVFGWSLVEVTFQAQTSTTRLTVQSQHTTATPVASLFDGARLHDGGRNPADAIAYVIDNYLPEMRRNTASFETAYVLLKGWQFGAYLPDPGESQPLLERMAFQCKSRLIPDNQGRVQLKVIDGTEVIALEIDEDDISEDTLRIEPEPLDTLYSEFYLWYGLRTGASPESPESYQGLVSAAPTATTHPERSLHLACEAARATLRRDRRWNILADFIRDETTAHKLLEFLVNRHTVQRDLVTCEMPYRASGIELGDQVALRHRLLNQDEPRRGEVLSVEYDGSRGTVRLQVRVGAFLGIEEDWEWPYLGIEGSGVTEGWES